MKVRAAVAVTRVMAYRFRRGARHVIKSLALFVLNWRRVASHAHRQNFPGPRVIAEVYAAGCVDNLTKDDRTIGAALRMGAPLAKIASLIVLEMHRVIIAADDYLASKQ